ncbi:hypothetical protein DFJ73DRAFT_419541 [Zopfochytrium polystomum]|nr:hypothetical protein DFJ73DRAFT_419541 [Zopfochytrium polystomum]
MASRIEGEDPPAEPAFLAPRARAALLFDPHIITAHSQSAPRLPPSSSTFLSDSSLSPTVAQLFDPLCNPPTIEGEGHQSGTVLDPAVGSPASNLLAEAEALVHPVAQALPATMQTDLARKALHSTSGGLSQEQTRFPASVHVDGWESDADIGSESDGTDLDPLGIVEAPASQLEAPKPRAVAKDSADNRINSDEPRQLESQPREVATAQLLRPVGHLTPQVAASQQRSPQTTPIHHRPRSFSVLNSSIPPLETISHGTPLNSPLPVSICTFNFSSFKDHKPFSTSRAHAEALINFCRGMHVCMLQEAWGSGSDALNSGLVHTHFVSPSIQPSKFSLVSATASTLALYLTASSGLWMAYSKSTSWMDEQTTDVDAVGDSRNLPKYPPTRRPSPHITLSPIPLTTPSARTFITSPLRARKGVRAVLLDASQAWGPRKKLLCFNLHLDSS